jgi:ribosomal protein S18 acetylase RimI-like enzyme
VLHLEAPAAPPLLHRIAGVLVGAATVQAGDPPEVCLLVHPAHRRRGVGRRLLGRPAAVCRRRGAAELLLTVDERSAGGQAFAEAVGGRYRSSEYRMELERVPEERPWPTPVRLRPATPADAVAFAHVEVAAFGEPDAAARARGVEAGMREPHHRYTLAELEGRPIGTLRVSAYAGTVYLTAFGVLPERQGQGFGRQLLTRTVRGLAAEGWSPIRIEVDTENRAALGLYRSCGFRELAGYAYYALDLAGPRPG